MRILRSLLILIIISASAGHSAEYWNQYDNPQESYRVMAAFNGELYLYQEFSPRGIYKTTDFTDLEFVLETANDIRSMAVHKGRLYAFTGFAGFLDTFDRIYSTSDGLNWDSMQQPGITGNIDNFRGAISYGEYLYVAKGNGEILRALGDQFPTTFSTVATLDNLGSDLYGFFIDFAVFNDRLHAILVKHNNFQIHHIDLYADINGFTHVGELPPDLPPQSFDFLPKFSVHGKNLYVSKSSLWKTDGTSIPYQWVRDDSLPPAAYYPVVIFDQLHIYSETEPLKVLNANGAWEVAHLSIFEKPHPNQFKNWYNRRATLGNRAFIIGDGVFHLEKGGIGLTYKPQTGGNFFIDQEDIVVLGISSRVNIEDTLKITLRNYEDAIYGRDIKQIKILQSLPAGMGSALVEIGQMTPDPTDPLIWIIDTTQPIFDGSDILIAVDLAPTLKDGVKARFAIEIGDIDFNTNSSYSPPNPFVGPLFEFNSLPSTADGPAPIADAILYPQPARDQVTFNYDLASTSDVTIKIFNRRGILVSEINDLSKSPGVGVSSTWNSSTVGPGVYFAHIKISSLGGGERQFSKRVYIDK